MIIPKRRPSHTRLDQSRRIFLPKDRILTWEEWTYLGMCNGRYAGGLFTLPEYAALPRSKPLGYDCYLTLDTRVNQDFVFIGINRL